MPQDPQKGVSLIIVFFISVIILLVTLSVSVILYGELKVLRDVNNSMVALYSAESGIEKVLYYDRQVLPSGASRGLCAMPANCIPDPSQTSNIDHGIYCNGACSNGSCDVAQISGGDCAANSCTDCTVTFSTTFDGRAYAISAVAGTSPSLDLTSNGVFGGASRQIEITSQ